MQQNQVAQTKGVEEEFANFIKSVENSEKQSKNPQSFHKERHVLVIDNRTAKQKVKTLVDDINREMMRYSDHIAETDFVEAIEHLVQKLQTKNYFFIQLFHKQIIVKEGNQLFTFHLLIVSKLKQEEQLGVNLDRIMLLTRYAIIQTVRKASDFSNSIPNDLYYLDQKINSLQEKVDALLNNYIKYFEKQTQKQINMPVSFIQDQIKATRNRIYFPEDNISMFAGAALFAQHIQKQMIDAVGISDLGLPMKIAFTLFKKFQKDRKRQQIENFLKIIGYKGSLIRFDVLTVMKIIEKEPRRSILSYALYTSRKTLFNIRDFPYNQLMRATARSQLKVLEAQINEDIKEYIKQKHSQPSLMVYDQVYRKTFYASFQYSEMRKKLKVVEDELNKVLKNTAGIYIDGIPQQYVYYAVQQLTIKDQYTHRRIIGNKDNIYRYDLLLRWESQRINKNKDKNSFKESTKMVFLAFVLVIQKRKLSFQSFLQGKFLSHASLREDLRELVQKAQDSLSIKVSKYLQEKQIKIEKFNKELIKKNHYFTVFCKEERKEKLDAFMANVSSYIIIITDISWELQRMNHRQLIQQAADFLSKAIIEEQGQNQFRISTFEPKIPIQDRFITMQLAISASYLVVNIQQLPLLSSQSPLKIFLLPYAMLVYYKSTKVLKSEPQFKFEFLQRSLTKLMESEQKKQEMIVSMHQRSTRKRRFTFSTQKRLGPQDLEPLFADLKKQMIADTNISSDQLGFQAAQFIMSFLKIDQSQTKAQTYTQIMRYKDKLVRFDLLVVIERFVVTPVKRTHHFPLIVRGVAFCYALYTGWKVIHDLDYNQQKIGYAMIDTPNEQKNTWQMEQKQKNQSKF